MNEQERQRWMRQFHTPEQTQARVIVLPHAGGSANFYFGLSAEICAGGVECIAIQYPGRQDRFSEDLIASIEVYADSIAEVIAGLDDKPTMLFGHSMGALIGYNLLARHASELPGVDVFLASAHLPPHRRVPDSTDFTSDEAVLAHLKKLGGSDDPLLADPAVRELILPAVKNDLQAVAAFQMTSPATLQVPIVAVIGQQDAKTSRESATSWADCTSEDFQLFELPGGHFYFADEPTELARIILQTLQTAGVT